MAHRIVLSEKAVEALGSLESDLRLVGAYSRRQRNALVSQLIVDVKAQASERTFEEVLEKITPPSQRRRALLKRLEALTQGMDEEAMRGVEAGLTKLTNGGKRGRPRKSQATGPTEIVQSEN